MVCAELDRLGLAYVMLHQRRFAHTRIDLEVVDGQLAGRLTVDGTSLSCAGVTGVYTRLMDWRQLPEVVGGGDDVAAHARQWHEVISTWIEIHPGRVMNRAAATASNQSKPYQAQLITQTGFLTPPTLITNVPDEVRAFKSQHGQVIYKSISGVRSIVRLLDDDALSRLARIRWCPVQFQRYLRGTNVRVHVVSGEVFATRITTDGVDYRYARRYGGRTDLTPWALPDELAQRCVHLAARLGLELAGIDLLLADDGGTYCFEVNPGPAFSFYEANTGQPIAHAIALALSR
ncbi:ATP-grasp ribosomal peptide maturase [Catellatospora chokoriensis]|uniref:ATP-grasp ribosomal peptide maturase n=2 Tax=Catellatospora chokoriensis TaxID=310353 RepID=A0A8J3NXB0_9ACTN|nr:ATP-grasp ribosomal peptide maturase [Catellatospora chokoriensis]